MASALDGFLTSPWLFVGVAYPVWGCLGLLLSEWRHYAYWNPRSIGRTVFPRLASTLFWLHRGLWLFVWGAALSVVDESGQGTPSTGPTSSWAVVLTWFLPLLIDLVIACRRAYQERRDAGDTNRSNLWRSLGLRFTPLLVVVAMAVGWFLCLLLYVVLRGSLIRRWYGIPLLLEPTPLLDEMVYIGARFGPRVRNVYLLPGKSSRKWTYGQPFAISSPGRKLKDAQLVTPLEHVVQLEPSTTTAVYALMQARHARPGSLAAWVRRSKTASTVAQLVLVLGLLVGAVVGIYCAAAMASSFRGPLQWTCAILGAVAAVVLLIYAGTRLLGYAPSSIQAHRAAFKAWAEADGGRPRSIEDFAFAAADYLCFREVISRPEVVYLKLLRNRPLCKLVREQGQEPETLFRALTDRLGLVDNPAPCEAPVLATSTVD